MKHTENPYHAQYFENSTVTIPMKYYLLLMNKAEQFDNIINDKSQYYLANCDYDWIIYAPTKDETIKKLIDSLELKEKQNSELRTELIDIKRKR